MSSLISSDKIKTRHFHSTKHFIEDLCTINYGGELGRSICEIYPKELNLKAEHQGDHATFLKLDIIIEGGEKGGRGGRGNFICKIFDKRDSFPFQLQ